MKSKVRYEMFTIITDTLMIDVYVNDAAKAVKLANKKKKLPQTYKIQGQTKWAAEYIANMRGMKKGQLKVTKLGEAVLRRALREQAGRGKTTLAMGGRS